MCLPEGYGIGVPDQLNEIPLVLRAATLALRLRSLAESVRRIGLEPADSACPEAITVDHVPEFHGWV